MVNYFVGVVLLNTFPMYIYGSGLMTGWQFIKVFAVEHTVEAAATFAVNYFISKLTPFPLNEFLTASGFSEVSVSIGIAVLVGSVVASVKWRAAV